MTTNRVTMELTHRRGLCGHSPDFPAFCPQLPWRGPFLQTAGVKLRRALEEVPEHQAESFEVPTSDGSGDLLGVRLFLPERESPEVEGRPLVVLFPGLAGWSGSHYMQASINHLLRQGFAAAGVDFRNCGAVWKKSQGFHHPGRLDDVLAVLRFLLDAERARGRWQGAVAVGYSLGGNMVLRAMAREDLPENLLGGAVISAPLDLDASSIHAHRWSGRLFERVLLRCLKWQVLNLFEDLNGDEAKQVRRSRSIREFDSVFTAPRLEFPAVEDYYRFNNASAAPAGLQRPSLVIYSHDDPLIPRTQYKAINWEHAPLATPLLVRGGGHLGFHTKGGASRWHDRCLVEFCSHLVGTYQETSVEIVQPR